MSEVIDLDALAPQSIVVKIGNEEVTIEPPSLENVLRLGGLTERMTKLSDDKVDLGEATGVIDQIVKQIYKCAPALEGKNLNVTQILKLVEIITDSATPPDVKELKAKGISTDTDDSKKEQD